MPRLDDSITLVIPTHGRAAFLVRALEHYREFDGKIVVVDSSPDRIDDANLPRRVDYRHFPGSGYTEKMRSAFKAVDTDYSLIAADDDFINLEAVGKALEFMEANPDYAIVQGWHTSFRLNERGKVRRQWMIHAFAHDYHIDADDPCTRLRQQLNPYLNNFYGLQRTAIWQDFFGVVCPDLEPTGVFSIPVLFELIQAIHCVFRGKHKVLPIFWIAREQLPESLAGKSAPSIHDCVESGDLENFKQSLAECLSRFDGLETETIRTALDDALHAFINEYSVQWESGELAHLAPVEQAIDSPRSREILETMIAKVCEHQARPETAPFWK